MASWFLDYLPPVPEYDGSAWQIGFITFYLALVVGYGILYVIGVSDAAAHKKAKQSSSTSSSSSSSSPAVGVVSGLSVYPVKSMGGMSVDKWEVGVAGFVGDRAFCTVREVDGTFFHARTHPHMLTLSAQLSLSGPLSLSDRDEFLPASGWELTVTSPGPPSDVLSVTSDLVASPMEVSVWSSEMSASRVENGVGSVGEWVTAAVTGGEEEAVLVTTGASFARPIPESYVDSMGGVGIDSHSGFDDSLPYLLIGTASLDALNGWLVEDGLDPVPMERFRPNIVVETSVPFEEDHWRRIMIGNVEFAIGAACSRCRLTTIDPATGVFTKAPFTTLMSRRRAKGASRPLFGVKLVALSSCIGDTVSVSDPVVVLERSDHPITTT